MSVLDGVGDETIGDAVMSVVRAGELALAKDGWNNAAEARADV